LVKFRWRRKYGKHVSVSCRRALDTRVTHLETKQSRILHPVFYSAAPDSPGVWEQLNAPFGSFVMDMYAASTDALKSGSATEDYGYRATSNRASRAFRTRAARFGERHTTVFPTGHTHLSVSIPPDRPSRAGVLRDARFFCGRLARLNLLSRQLELFVEPASQRNQRGPVAESGREDKVIRVGILVDDRNR